MKISWLTCPSRGARKLRHSFSITGTWMVCESPWVQKHRNFWEGSIKRLLAQNNDKEPAAILFPHFCETTDQKHCGFKRAYFQNGRSQSTTRGSSRKTERRVQSLETQSPQGLLLISPSFNCSEAIVTAVCKTVLSSKDAEIWHVWIRFACSVCSGNKRASNFKLFLLSLNIYWILV